MNLQALLPYICLVVGICVFVSGIAIRKKLQSSESWPKTVGVIRESAVQPGFTRTGGSNFIYVVRPKVVYEYHVEGRKHTSSQLALIEYNSANKNLAEEKAERYSVGQQIDVYYNPQKPEFAVLTVGDPTNGKLPCGTMILGIVLTVSGIVCLLAVHR